MTSGTSSDSAQVVSASATIGMVGLSIDQANHQNADASQQSFGIMNQQQQSDPSNDSLVK